LITTAVRHLGCEVGPHGPRRASADDVANLLLSALLVRLAPPVTQDERSNGVFHRFRTLVEQGFREHHDVGYYARALGYDPRTVSRAAHAAIGRSAKAYLDERVLLEAKRLLAYDRLTPTRCADWPAAPKVARPAGDVGVYRDDRSVDPRSVPQRVAP